MIGDIVYGESDWLRKENAKALRERSAALKKCSPLALSCNVINDK